jgi:UDP-N-acetylmuramoyl-tripeptide--D-alanyl-D-alanine ligase
MRAALALLGQAEINGSKPRRRIAVLGDMLELGPSGRELHRSLADAVAANRIDLVFCCGPLMHALWETLPSDRRGRYAEGSAELQPHVLAAVRSGDIVMVKGSLGSRMAVIVKALENHATRAGAAHFELRP